MEKIYQIGVLLGSIHTQHPREIVLGLYDEAVEANVNLTFFMGAQVGEIDISDKRADETIKSYNYQYNALYDYAFLGKMDALIIAYGTLFIFLNDQDKVQFLKKFSDVPLVILESCDDLQEYNYIMSDNYSGMKAIVEHLIEEHGYKKILHLSGPDNNTDAYLRKKAYIDAMTEHGLKVEEHMIAKGDYTPNIKELVIKLLDNNLDAEAVVCANDEMASCVYEVCNERGLIVGRDIAVTGYDDVELAQRLDPPLTTTMQDGIEMGHRALKYAIETCKNNKLNTYIMPAPLRVRGSCGCNYLSNSTASMLVDSYQLIRSSRDYPFINGAAAQAVNYSLRNGGSSDVVDQLMKLYVKLIHVLLDIRNGAYLLREVEFLQEEMVSELRILKESGCDQHINTTRFLECLRQLVDYEIANSKDGEKLLLLHYYIEAGAKYIESMVAQTDTNRIARLIEQTRDIPQEFQRLLENASDEKIFYQFSMELIKNQGISNSYLMLLEQPIVYKRNESFSCPDKIVLVASLEDGNISVFEDDDRIIFTREKGFSTLYADKTGKKYITNILFAESVQYGILLTEAKVSDVDSLFSLCTQLSNALAYRQSIIKEAAMKESLYKTLKELEDKNQILSFISINDQLTGIYNRRGFMEKFMEISRRYDGKRAFLFFCDVDHLKEVNDVFGHYEGDNAIIQGAKALDDVMKKYESSYYEDEIVSSPVERNTHVGLCGRIGGDEFVALILCDNAGVPEIIKRELNTHMKEYNSTSGKPYYVEFSVGYVEFICKSGINMDEVMNKADQALYEAKKNRRKSIKK